MDDLDHSIHIAECDWTYFYAECEECCFRQPSLAGLENSSLSDSEDSESPATDTGELDVQLSPITTTKTCQPSDCYSEVSVQINQCGSGEGQQHDLTVQTKEGTVALESPLESEWDSTICQQYHGADILNSKPVQGETAEEIMQVTDHSTTHMLIAQQRTHDDSASTDLQEAYGGIERESGVIELTFIQEPASLVGQHGELNVDMHNADRTTSVRKTDRSVALSTEKERWFVTLDGGPLRQRVPAGAGATKKKRRRKKPFKNTDAVRSDRPELPPLSGSEFQRDEVNGSEAEEDDEHLGHRTSGTLPRPHILPERKESRKMSTASSFSDEEGNVPQKMCLEVSPHPPTVLAESYMDNNKRETRCSAVSLEKPKPVSLPTPMIHDTLRNGNTKWQDDVESEDFEDSAEFFSTYDSENYLSAAESATDDPEHIIRDCLTERPSDVKHLPQRCTSLSQTTLSNLFMFPETAHVHNTKDTEVYPCDIQDVHLNAVSNDKASTVLSENNSPQVPRQSEGYEDTVDKTPAKPATTFPSTGQSADLVQGEDNTTMSENEKQSSASHEEAPGGHETPVDSTSFTHSDLVEDQPKSPPPIPDFTVTPCPEEYDEPLGPNRPVYAISAFWDEMEKLTIKDILQLRTTRSPSPKEKLNVQETTIPRVDITDAPTSSPVDTADYLLPDNASMDTSDTADSGYFAQLDDSKQDRSSCDFSISDVDEEYWQFLGTSRNPTPEPQDLKQGSQSTTDCEFQEEGDTDGVGTETPVDVEQLPGQCFEDRRSNIFLSNEFPGSRTMTRRKSMQNVLAHDTETQEAPLESTPEKGLAEKGLAEKGLAEKGLAEKGLAEKGLAEKGLAENGLAEKGLAEKGLAEKGLAEKGLAEKGLAEKGLAEKSDHPATDENTCAMLRMRTLPSVLSYTDILNENYQISFPEIFEYLFMEDEPKDHSRTVKVYGSKAAPAAETYDDALSQYESEIFLPPPQYALCSDGKPVPIFSCARPPVRDLTFPELDYLFLPQDPYAESEEDDDSSPIRVVSRSHGQARDSTYFSATPDGQLLRKRGWSRNWTGWFSLRNVCIPDKGRSWCRRSGAWVFPIQDQKTPIQTAIVIDSAAQQRLFRGKTFSLSQQEGLFSTLRQSDMCLVCIAVASWVLRSSDPQAADTWKAALLANVSAISAIQYLRHYVMKNPPQDDP